MVKGEQHFNTVEQTCTVPDSGKTCDISWIMDYWLAKRSPGEEEARAFNEDLAAELGTESLASGVNMAERDLLTLFRDGWAVDSTMPWAPVMNGVGTSFMVHVPGFLSVAVVIG